MSKPSKEELTKLIQQISEFLFSLKPTNLAVAVAIGAIQCNVMHNMFCPEAGEDYGKVHRKFMDDWHLKCAILNTADPTKVTVQ
jgi:hypothetical protein